MLRFRAQARPPTRLLRAVVALCVLITEPAHATWSLVAIDRKTNEVGIAGASCNLAVEVIAGVRPGVGAVVAQSVSNLQARDKALEMLAAGQSPKTILGTITSAEFDSVGPFDISGLRQYGVASLAVADAPATFTGQHTIGWAGAATAPSVAVQGNMLRHAGVLEDAFAAYSSSPTTATLADRLMRGLVAAARAGGDYRCEASISALAAFLIVAKPNDPPDRPHLQLLQIKPGEEPPTKIAYLFLELWRTVVSPVKGQLADNPVLLLDRKYRSWKSTVESRETDATTSGDADVLENKH